MRDLPVGHIFLVGFTDGKQWTVARRQGRLPAIALVKTYMSRNLQRKPYNRRFLRSSTWPTKICGISLRRWSKRAS